MNILHQRNLFKMKSVLCALLALYGPIALTGCGNNMLGPAVPLAQIQIPLGPDHPLTAALAGTTFQGAVAMDILPVARQFRLVFRDEERQVSGSYDFQGGEIILTGVDFKNTTGAASVQFDPQRRVESITTSAGEAWVRPADDVARAVETGDAANAYIAANADLIAIAQSMDENRGAASPTSNSSTGGSSTTPGVIVQNKPNQADALILNAVLASIAAIWAPVAGILYPLLAFFTVATIVEKTSVARFNGTWSATNANANLLVTINDGKITKLVDADSDHELTIVDSRLDRLDGARVTWIVLATVLGQETEVEFAFDVEEMSNGTLEGTLTAVGSSFARVPVTMTRI
ncbi:MAG TPA: hypothetical protein VJZ71_13485 [Phycisphaerae bacterium]|nr:hypothetical protein [Phycisphaerae bacterium]